MGKELRCGDLMKGCQQVIKADTEQELLQKAGEHAKSAHQVQTVSPEMAAKVKAAIRTV